MLNFGIHLPQLIKKNKTMKTITLTKDLEEKITHWKIKADVVGVTKIIDTSFKKSECRNPETAIKRFKKKWGKTNNLVLTGLLVHAETKPIIYQK